MPRDSNGTHSLPSGYLAVTGQPIEASQHNPPLEDLSNSITGSVARNGSAPMQANLPMAGFKVTGMADGVAATDAVTKGQLDSVTGVGSAINGAAVKTDIADDDRIVLTDSADAFVIKRSPWGNVKTLLSSIFALRSVAITGGGLATGGGTLTEARVITVTEASQPQAEAGTAQDVVMTPLRTAQAIAALGLGAVTDTFIANGTWTKRTGAKAHLVQIWAAGGTGGVGVGGGGGEYVEAWLRAADLASTQAVVVGAGGSPAGGNSSFAGIVANGGGAVVSPGVPGAGGTGSTSPTKEAGGAGGNPAGTNTFYSGAGGGNSAGVSLFGGNRGTAPGGGGNTGSGAGARGEVRVTTFF